MTRIRLATFNLESLDDRPGVLPIAARVTALRPVLDRLNADLLCLQEVNAQKPGKSKVRRLDALDAVLRDTPYAAYHRVATQRSRGGPEDVHNLVTLSRWPIVEHRQVRHDLVSAPVYRLATSLPTPARPKPVAWDRPLLDARVVLPNGHPLHVVNLHLRAPLASAVDGQKLAPFVWRSAAGWAEGFYMSAMKRAGQALEVRLLIDGLFDGDADAMIVVAGDLNAEAHEVPVRVLCADVEETGNPTLAFRSLSAIENEIAGERRFSVLHRDRRLMLDHLLVSPALKALYRRAEILNEGLLDEYYASLKQVANAASFHAPVVAEFELQASAGSP